ncbi:MAG: protein translocase subunit SecD [Parcubacteria group bacterium]|jgi:preprotein translocase subunit SecD
MTVRRKIWLKFSLVVVLFLITALIAYPKPIPKPAWLGNTLAKLKINLGLDLQGGIHLIYKVDTSGVDSAKVPDALSGLQDVIERRVNAFGVAEPLIETSKSGSEQRLIVELAGVRDIEAAKAMIKETPFLEFKEQQTSATEQIPQDQLDKANAVAKAKADDILKRALAGEDFSMLAKDNSEDSGSKSNGGDLGFTKKGEFVPEFDQVLFDVNFKDGTVYPQLVESQFGWHIIKKIEARGDGDNLEIHSAHILIAKKVQPEAQITWVSTGLTGKNLKSAQVDFQGQGLSEPKVALQFDSEGAQLFTDITKRNIGKPLAILLDNLPITDTNGDGVIDNLDPPYAPIIQGEISGGKAEITGHYTMEEANNLVKRLNEGALPMPITLIGQQSVEASLGQISLNQSLKAGLIGIILVMIFMMIYYRFLGIVASIALIVYSSLMVAIFKISSVSPWSITLTLAGIAGFILSVGMAVDANILIFERTKEEIRKGRSMRSAIDEGHHRAWPSIRDSNISTIITSLILIWFGTGFVKGFAITLLLGVLVSMFTAIILVRIILTALIGEWAEHKKSWIIAGAKNEESTE